MNHILYLLIMTFSLSAVEDVYVDGYTRSDGTYVQGHYRSSPNNTVTDNFSTDGNVNPYTGVEGSRNVDDDAYDYSDSPNDSANLYATQSNNNNDVEAFLIILGVIAGLAIVIYIWKLARKQLFLRYLASKIKVTFWIWVFLTVLNQVVFFGACLAPYCILASIPHVSLITFGIMYLTYKSVLETYDPETGYNEFGYDKDGYDMNGYRMDGYDKHGYNAKGLDRDGKDRLGTSFIGRLFADNEYKEKISNMNKIAKEVHEQIVPTKKTMTEMDRFFNEPSVKEPNKQGNENMDEKNILQDYKNVSDKDTNIKNFRLYHKGKTTNLVWYGGKIIYVPKDYFLMKNLVNINHATGRKCILYKPDVDLINEMKEKNIVFTLAEDIQELMDRLNASGLNIGMLLSDELGVETISDVDYSEYNGPIYDEDGSWNIKS